MIIMNSKKNVIINAIIIGTIIIGFVTINFFTNTPAPKTLSFENVGLQAPIKPLNGDAGTTTSLKDFRGQNILIHFWASWCEACAADHKTMEQIAKSYQSNPAVKIIGIASSDRIEAIEKSGLAKNSSYPQFLDESGNLALAMGVKSLPQTMLVDTKGRVLYHLKRPFDSHQVEQLEKRLNEFSHNRVPSFSFQTSSDKTITETNLEQKIWVADFIFTSCPGQCPMMTAKMRQLQDTFKNDDRFKLVSISVDPDTDTFSAMKSYEKKHNMNSEKWYFLRGEIEKVKTLLVNGFKLGTMEEPEFHTDKFVLVDQSNKIFGYYDSSSAESFEKLKSDITKLLK